MTWTRRCATAEHADVEWRQVFDVPPMNVRATEHQLIAPRYRCGTATLSISAHADRPAPSRSTLQRVDYQLASNFKCLCRQHHLIKTFWHWPDKQLPDGTVIWKSPSGQTYVTTPGSALLFPSLCVPTGDLPAAEAPADERCSDRTAMMPLRTTTRAQNRAERVAAERRQNREARETRRRAPESAWFGPAPPSNEHEEPPPF